MNKNPYEKFIEKKCAVCDKTIMVDQYGGGDCSFNKEELIKKMGLNEFMKKYLAGELYPEI